MKNIAKFSIKSVYGNIDPMKKDNTFEVKNFTIRFLVLITWLMINLKFIL